MRGIREEFEREYGEPGYSVNEFASAVAHFGSTTIDTVRKHVSKQNLGVDLKKMGIDLTGSKAKYLIPESNLEDLMESIGVKVTLEDFKEELEFLRRKASSNIHRVGRNRKTDRDY